jgi:hypothetical protein
MDSNSDHHEERGFTGHPRLQELLDAWFWFGFLQLASRYGLGLSNRLLGPHSCCVVRHIATAHCVHFPDGTRRFNSSNQFSTTLICGLLSLVIIKKRWPSGDTS